MRSLAEAWAAHLATVPVSAEASATAAYLFRQPSLFEVRCPHFLPRYVRDARAGYDLLDAGNASAAAEAFGRALGVQPDFAPALAGLLTADAARGRVTPVRLAPVLVAARDTAASALTLRAAADAARLLADDPLADTLYARASRRLAPTDRVSRLALRLRSRLSAPALATLFLSPGDPARAAAGAASPFHAALLWTDAGEPARAWASIRRVPTAGLPPDERGALRLVGAQLAYRAGRLGDSERLAALAGADLHASGAEALAAVAADWQARVRWRLGGNRG